ncbi:MAG: peptide deformylase [Oceanicaulis sp.]|uniref:peptide deformylase n=1 Tax=Glycocaulis sp. TaxID=1969725 RepID=UPI0025B82EE4|nr:peptide deformylase [Glycocaulis sp.]MCC5980187.1 peptide deformylase [Oceanicaulis sp.]MCH8521919.1 peptide deformylase [Glycocaulis sp.]
MAVHTILTVPDPRLKLVSRPVDGVDDDLRTLMDDMVETMYAADGIGLAAIQIGVDKRVIVMDLSEKRDNPRYFVNPVITPLTEETRPYSEGCLSIPEIYEEIERPARVKVEYLDYDGNQREEIAEDLFAVCIQHEMDHLEGVLFIDYLSRLKRDRAVKRVQKLVRSRMETAQ